MKILMKGNEAIAQAAINAGCKAFFGYPITPQNEIPEYMAAKLSDAGGVFIQAESEVASINMVYGAAATGARVMTSSSSPGIALMQEGISTMAGARVPALIVSVSRGGPGLGGILPSQADYFQATRGGGNGDYYLPVYAPSTIQEATDLVYKAFEVGDKYLVPVMLLADGMLGQMMEPVELSNDTATVIDKSKWAASGDAESRGHKNVANSLNLAAKGLEDNNLLLQETYKEIKKNETMYEKDVKDDAEIIIVAYGTPSRIVRNAMEVLEEEGIKVGLIRPITLWPFPDEAFKDLPSTTKAILVAELSMGQMVEDVRLAVNGALPVHYYGRTGGVVFEPSEIVEETKKILNGGK